MTRASPRRDGIRSGSGGNIARNAAPLQDVQPVRLGKCVAYSDLIKLGRLCLPQANAARTPAAANELRRMAKEYQSALMR
jgi:hypothetical protein